MILGLDQNRVKPFQVDYSKTILSFTGQITPEKSQQRVYLKAIQVQNERFLPFQLLCDIRNGAVSSIVTIVNTDDDS